MLIRTSNASAWEWPSPLARSRTARWDAFFWDGGLPTAAVLDLGATPGVSIVVIPHGDAVPKMTQKYGPVYFEIKIPKGTYGGQDVEVPVAGVANLLVAHEKMEESLVYNIVKVMFDHKDELVAVHKEAENLKLESAIVGSSVPFHPGAIKFYKEKGVWKE
ncbi:MAG: TAXI family TRAP transporter solute-binding subunit [Chloroflexota bacterium]